MIDCAYPFCGNSTLPGKPFCRGHACQRCGAIRIGGDYCQECQDSIDAAVAAALPEEKIETTAA